MSEFGETFFTSVGCMDGRVQAPVAELGRRKFGALFPDTITEAGLVGLLARLQSPETTGNGGQANNPKKEMLDSLKEKLLISLQKHDSRGIIVHGHAQCAGNPVDDARHKQDVLSAVEVIKSLIDIPVLIVPVFVYPGKDGWTCEEIFSTAFVDT